MSISFERNKAQCYIEHIFGVTSFEEIKQKVQEFKAHSLSTEEALNLAAFLKSDAIDFFYSGTISFTEGIDAINKGRFSWATIKLYYSIYYFIRTSLACKGYAIIRCGNMFRLYAHDGEQPYSTTNRKYNTTHEGTINHFKDIFSSSDTLLTNRIDDTDVYAWMMDAREIVNYRSASFKEPECLEFWDHYNECRLNGSLRSEFSRLKDDMYILCFQKEFAIVAIPIKRLIETINDIKQSGLISQIVTPRFFYPYSILKSTHSYSILQEIFDDADIFPTPRTVDPARGGSDV